MAAVMHPGGPTLLLYFQAVFCRSFRHFARFCRCHRSSTPFLPLLPMARRQ
ncbi:hypothetical protein KCP78_01465 [Salmonella enterica subsp. enterica]|nr:hypothetical protein KCP78_01465 [Salmonella enterica subsp. enterica]